MSKAHYIGIMPPSIAHYFVPGTYRLRWLAQGRKIRRVATAEEVQAALALATHRPIPMAAVREQVMREAQAAAEPTQAAAAPEPTQAAPAPEPLTLEPQEEAPRKRRR